MTPDIQVSFASCLVFILLVPFAIVGLALINTGLGRSRSAAHAMTAMLLAVCTAVITYFAFGLAVQGWPIHTNLWGGFALDFAPGPVQPGMFFRGVHFAVQIPALLALFSVALSSLIPLGAAADRWRLRGCCVSTVLFAGCAYPLFARFAWHGLATLHSQFPSDSTFLDVGGSGVINVTGGLAALSVAWLLGPRQGKYSSAGMPAAIPAHNQVFVLFGCMLALVGWVGLSSSAWLLNTPDALPRMVAIGPALIALNTMFSAASAALTSAITTRIRFRRPDASLIANGWMAGLVASSAGCAMLKPATAIITGIVAGALVVLSVEWFELHFKVDDPCGSISVHGVCGIWGLLAAGIFSGGPGQFTAQIVGIATLLGFIFPMTYGLNWILNRFIPYRVSLDGERQGLDLHELGADAYPEFVVHADEFLQR